MLSQITQCTAPPIAVGSFHVRRKGTHVPTLRIQMASYTDALQAEAFLERPPRLCIPFSHGESVSTASACTLFMRMHTEHATTAQFTPASKFRPKKSSTETREARRDIEEMSVGGNFQTLEVVLGAKDIRGSGHCLGKPTRN